MLDWLRRWWDAWKHPEEYRQQRIRRRYLEGVQLAERDRQRMEQQR